MRHVMLSLAVLLCLSLAQADTIIVDGQVYRDITIKDSGSRYYFFTPDGTAMSVSKTAVGPNEIAFGDEPLAEAAKVAEEPAEATAMSTVVSTADAVDLPPPAPVQAGAATVDLLRAGRGGLEANAVAITAGEHTLAIVALDLAAIDKPLVDRIYERLAKGETGLTPENCIIAATGRYTDAQTGILEGTLEQVFFGQYMAEVASQVAGAAEEALQAAMESKAPASLRIAEAQVPEVHASNGGDGASLDSTLTVLQATKADGTPLGYIVNFALYPAFGPDALPGEGRGAVGALDAALEAVAGLEVPLAFLNGAAADTTPDFSRGEEAVGDVLATAALDALAAAEAMPEVGLIPVSRSASLPPTLLEGLVPTEAGLIEAHLGDAVFMTVPASLASQPGYLLRIKAMQSGAEHVFIATQAGGFAGLFPSVEGFFAGDIVQQSSFYGPLAGKWLAETYLPGVEVSPPMWQNLPELKPYANTFTEAREKGQAEAEDIRARYSAVSEGLGKLTDLVRNAKSLLGDKAPPELEKFLPLIEALDDQQVQAIVKQLAAAMFRSQGSEFTAEQRARLMGAAEGAGIPFDGVVLLQALSDLKSLPQEAQMFVGMAQAQGGDLQGYAFL